MVFTFPLKLMNFNVKLTSIPRLGKAGFPLTFPNLYPMFTLSFQE